MRGMVPEDVFDLCGVADPRVSPDGRTVAFVEWWIDRESREYRSAIGLVPASGGEPRRLTAGAARDASPRWSPDGSRIAFTSTRDGATAQLYVMPVDGGEPRRVTSLTESVTSPAWSPDGSRIAFAARVRDAAYDEEDDAKRAPRRITRLLFKQDQAGWTCDRPQRLFVVDAEGGDPVQLTAGDAGDDGAPAWSPDGSRIAFASARHDDWDLGAGSDIYVVEAAGGEPRPLTARGRRWSGPAWSPDGASIAAVIADDVGNYPRHAQIAVVDAASGEFTVLTASLDRNCEPFAVPREPAWDGDRIVFAVEDAGATHLRRVAASGGEIELLVGGQIVVGGFDVAGGVLAYTASTPVAPAELYVGGERRTHAGDPFASGRALVAPERFTAVSADGSEVEAWLMRPAGFAEGERYPVLLNIHGGPFTQYGYGFFDEAQVQAGAGYAVLYANPRGSSGYSEEWGRAIRGPANGQGPGMGSVDHEDVIAVVDTALERFPELDGERMGVLGGSYGGYLTSWIVAHTDRFRAACSERSVNFWPSMFGSSDLGWSFRDMFGADYFADPAAWTALSPAAYAERITTPLLIMHSENDLRCAVEQAEHLFTILRLLERPVEMVRFPAEGHELSRSGSPMHRVQRFEILLEWFGRHLGDGATRT